MPRDMAEGGPNGRPVYLARDRLQIKSTPPGRPFFRQRSLVFDRLATLAGPSSACADRPLIFSYLRIDVAWIVVIGSGYHASKWWCLTERTVRRQPQRISVFGPELSLLLTTGAETPAI